MGLEELRVKSSGPGRGAGTALIHFWRGRHLGPETRRQVCGRGPAGLMLVKFINTAMGRQIHMI